MNRKMISLQKDMENHILSISENLSDIIDIANLSTTDNDTSELLLSITKTISQKITRFERMSKTMITLFNFTESEEPKTPPEDRMEISSNTSETKDNVSTIPLRPQVPKRESCSSSHKIFSKLITITPFEEEQQALMKDLYSLQDTDYRYVDFSGIYPRINFLQDTPPQEIRKWYNFGCINTIYISPPDFKEISLLPLWVQEGSKDFYLNNPTVSPKDILVLKFISAGPDFEKEERYPSYHFIQIGKAESFTIKVPTERKQFLKYDKSDIHYRRAIGIRIILQNLENSFKRGFRTYGGQKIHSSLMISPARKTPPAAERYVQMKIQLLEKSIIKSSTEAQARICKFRKHPKDTCPACSAGKKKAENDEQVGTTSHVDPWDSE